MQKTITRHSSAANGIQWPSQLHPVLKRIYTHRKLTSVDELDCSLSQLISFKSLKNIDQAVACLYRAINNQDKIYIVGDFDADGATSTAVAYQALRAFGAKNIHFKVPHRVKYGYGLSPEIVIDIAKDNPQLIITVDSGIACVKGVDQARALGIDVLVTDHHLPGETLPNATVIVNPNQPGDQFPSKHLAGVGVIFYVMLALRAHLRHIDWFKQHHLPEPNLAKLLDLVALGTVADVVPLDHNNRILVSQGLYRIRHGQASPGIQALIQIANKSPERLVASDLGFALGPRLNAAGRLDDMSVGIQCLLSDNLATAQPIATQLNTLNQQRRIIEADMQIQALSLLQDINLDQAQLPRGLCLFEPSWHQGVVGILASRIKDKYHRPVIIFAQTDANTLKGSARSISGLNIRDVIEVISTQHSDLVLAFGGHAMAAGLTINSAGFEQFQHIFSSTIEQALPQHQLTSTIQSDGELNPDEINLDVAECLRNAGPWGQGFPEPIFDGHFCILQHRIVGDKHLKLRIRHPQSTQSLDAIAFNALNPLDDSHQSLQINKDQPYHIAYKLDVNHYKNQSNLQLILEYVQGL